MKGRLIRYRISGLNQTTDALHSWSNSKCCDSISALSRRLLHVSIAPQKCQIIPSTGKYDV